MIIRNVDAKQFLASAEAPKSTSSYIDIKRASITLGTFAEEHTADYSYNPAADSDRVRERSVLDRHILPALSSHPVGAIRPSLYHGALQVAAGQ